jgi:hypothetical protein
MKLKGAVITPMKPPLDFPARSELAAMAQVLRLTGQPEGPVRDPLVDGLARTCWREIGAGSRVLLLGCTAVRGMVLNMVQKPII